MLSNELNVNSSRFYKFSAVLAFHKRVGVEACFGVSEPQAVDSDQRPRAEISLVFTAWILEISSIFIWTL